MNKIIKFSLPNHTYLRVEYGKFCGKDTEREVNLVIHPISDMIYVRITETIKLKVRKLIKKFELQEHLLNSSLKSLQ